MPRRERYTQHEIITRYLAQQSPQWIPGYALDRIATDWGWLSHNASRRARELAERGDIARALVEGQVHYRYGNGGPVVIDADGTPYEQPALPLPI